MAETYRSRVYTDRPAYADYDAARKFDAIQGIIITRLKQHPNAICSYSGGAEYAEAEDKAAKRAELKARYPKCESTINFLCCCNSAGEPRPNIQLVINSSRYMLDFIREYPPPIFR